MTYNGNGNTGGSVPTDPNAYQQGDTVTVLGAGNLEKTGYTFTAWNTAANGSGTWYAPGAQFNMPGANVTLYAQWTQGQTHILTIAINPAAGGIVTKTPDKANYDHGENVQVTAVANAGYGFTGWSGDLAGTTNPATLTMDRNKTVTANFTLVTTYTVTYNGNGNTGGSVPTDPNAYQQGDKVTVPGPWTLERTGYTFSSWNTNADGSGTQYAPGAQFAMPAANVTLYARWTPEAIPTLSEWGMILLMSLLAGITLWRLRRETL